MSLSNEQKNIPVLPELVQNGPIPGDPEVLDQILYNGVDVDDPDNVIGIVFNTKADEQAFFGRFVEIL